MELCTTRGPVSTPVLPLSSSNGSFLKTAHFHFPPKKLSNFSGVISHSTRNTLLRVSSPDEKSNQFTEEKNEVVATLEDDVNDVRLDTAAPVNTSFNELDGVFGQSAESTGEGVEDSPPPPPSSDETLQPLKELLSKLNIELDVKDTPTILLYGGGALLSLWLLSAVVNAVDSIPVFPKLMEVVGLGYSLWFTTRYLLFKKNRVELGSKIEELKQEVFGSSDKIE